MKIFVTVYFASALLALVTAGEPSDVRQLKRSNDKGKGRGKDSSSSDNEFCENPAEAVLDPLDCFTDENTACVTAAYTPGFKTYHKEASTNQGFKFDSQEFWDIAVGFVDLSFEIKFSNNAGPNQASVRYIETVTITDGQNLGLPASTDYPFGYTVDQHEHAIVTVDNDCKMVTWEQYGDDKEQTDVTDATTALLCAINAGTCPSNRE